MTLPSLLKFEPTLKPGGVLFVNTSMVHQAPKRNDITIYEIPVSDMAVEMGNPRIANMIMLGAFVRKTNIVRAGDVEEVIREFFGTKGDDLVELNLKAFNYWNG